MKLRQLALLGLIVGLSVLFYSIFFYLKRIRAFKMSVDEPSFPKWANFDYRVYGDADILSSEEVEIERHDPKEIIFVLQIFRHGARSPREGFWDEELWKHIPEMHLTQLGKSEHYSLGRKMRYKYIKKGQLVSSELNPNEIFCRSTDYERTKTSINYQLFGLFDQTDLFNHSMVQKIRGRNLTKDDITYIEELIDNTPLPSWLIDYQPNIYIEEEDDFLTQKYCKRAYFITHNHVENSPEIRAIFQKNKAELEKILNIFGKKYESFEQVDLVKFLFSVAMAHYHLKLDNLTDSQISLVKELTDELFHHRYAPEKEPAILSAAPIVQYMIDIFQQSIKSYNELLRSNSSLDSTERIKLVLLSAHDYTLAFLLTAFEQSLEKAVPFAAALNFELIRHEKEYYLRVKYDSNPIKIRGCDIYCPFDTFVDKMKDVLSPEKIRARCEDFSDLNITDEEGGNTHKKPDL